MCVCVYIYTYLSIYLSISTETKPIYICVQLHVYLLAVHLSIDKPINQCMYVCSSHFGPFAHDEIAHAPHYPLSPCKYNHLS